MMDKSVSIRRVKAGDENSLAYVQTESWKEAFREIVPADILSQCTEIERAAEMYKMLLAENKGNGYILELDGRPHCIAWWDAAREENMRGFAELICIHSLRDAVLLKTVWSPFFPSAVIGEAGFLAIPLNRTAQIDQDIFPFL